MIVLGYYLPEDTRDGAAPFKPFRFAVLQTDGEGYTTAHDRITCRKHQVAVVQDVFFSDRYIPGSSSSRS